MSIENCSLALDEEIREEEFQMQLPELNLLLRKASVLNIESFLKELPVDQNFSAEIISGKITVSF